MNTVFWTKNRCEKGSLKLECRQAPQGCDLGAHLQAPAAACGPQGAGTQGGPGVGRRSEGQGKEDQRPQGPLGAAASLAGRGGRGA